MKKPSIIFTLFICCSCLSIAQTITIGTQVWMTKNLDVSAFRNGEPIPQAKTAKEWKNAGDKKQPAWCYYNFDASNGIKYGKLYNRYSIMDPRGIAPKGYHLLKEEEWEILMNYIGGQEKIDLIKSSFGWEKGGNGIDHFKLGILPSGSISSEGVFGGADGFGYYWTNSSYFHISFDNVDRYWDEMDDTESFGMSVRCLKD